MLSAEVDSSILTVRIDTPDDQHGKAEFDLQVLRYQHFARLQVTLFHGKAVGFRLSAQILPLLCRQLARYAIRGALRAEDAAK